MSRIHQPICGLILGYLNVSKEYYCKNTINSDLIGKIEYENKTENPK